MCPDLGSLIIRDNVRLPRRRTPHQVSAVWMQAIQYRSVAPRVLPKDNGDTWASSVSHQVSRLRLEFLAVKGIDSTERGSL